MEPFILENIQYTPIISYFRSYQVAVSGFAEGITDAKIPETVQHKGDTLQVLTVNSGSFANCHTLQSIQLPNTLQKVNADSFLNCKNLEIVDYSGDHDIFQKNAFKNCPKLQNQEGIVLFHDIVIDYFGKNTHITIPEGITEISHRAFQKNRKLVSVTFPNSLTEISFSAFESCPNLTEIHLPPNLQTLSDRAFALCKGLEKVVFPEHVTHIQEETFARCSNLKEIHFPEKLKVIQDDAFTHCTSLRKIHFPKHLKTIQKRAFYRCHNLNEIHFPESVINFGSHCFKGCDNLEIVTFHHKSDEKIKIPKNSFAYTEKGIHISDFVLKAWSPEERENFRFRQLCHWDELSDEEKSVFFKEWRSKRENNPIRNMVFQKGTAKELSIYFQEGFHLSLVEFDQLISDSIADGNTSKTAILLEYKNNHFTDEAIEEYETEKELIEIGLERPSLKQLKQKWEVTAIEDYLAITGYKGKNKEELIPEAINTGKTIKYVASAVFYAFWEENIGNSSANYPFSLQVPKCYAPLERILFQNGDEIFITEHLKESKIDEFHFSHDYRNIPEEFLFQCPYIKKVVLPSSVRCICRDAFRDCVGLEEVILSENLTILQAFCFHGCENLKSIHFPENLLEIANHAFQKCHSLEEIILPDSLKRLGRSVFSHCNKLKKVILPRNIKTFSPDIFEECPRLEFVGYDGGENLIEMIASGEFYI